MSFKKDVSFMRSSGGSSAATASLIAIYQSTTTKAFCLLLHWLSVICFCLVCKETYHGR